MRLIACFLMVLSLGLFTLGCAKPAGETGTTENPPAAGETGGAAPSTPAPTTPPATPAPEGGEKK